MLKSVATMMVLTFALSACARGGITTHFPKGVDTGPSARVVIARPNSIWGSGLRFQASLDGYEIAVLGPGEHISFEVEPGRHAIGEITGSQFSMKFEEGDTYYFVVRLHTELFGSNFYLSRSDKDAMSEHLKQSNDVSDVPYRATTR